MSAGFPGVIVITSARVRKTQPPILLLFIAPARRDKTGDHVPCFPSDYVDDSIMALIKSKGLLIWMYRARTATVLPRR